MERKELGSSLAPFFSIHIWSHYDKAWLVGIHDSHEALPLPDSPVEFQLSLLSTLFASWTSFADDI
jgi:hypothetical protein